MGLAGTFDSGLAPARARQALAEAGLDSSVELVRAASVTNEVWLSADHAVRVNRRPDRRLRREAVLARSLPPEVRYPEVVAYGTGSGFDWLVERRRPGRVLARSWPTMSQAMRRRAISEIAAMLRALHATEVPPNLPPLPDTPQLLVADADPARPLRAAIERLRDVDHVGQRLLDAVERMIDVTVDALDPFDETTLVHTDLTFENVLWDGERVTAIIDFEWARAGPADLELDVLMRYCAFPFLHVAPDYESATVAADYREVMWWLRDDYPSLFDRPRELDRVRLYSVAFEVRELLKHPPQAPFRSLNEHHPLRRLSALVAGNSYIDQLSS